jgi:phosphatidate cytidylyltransferase
MLKRTITGACYVAILAVTFLLREFVDYRLFHLLTYIFLIIGTYELQRMLRPFADKFIGVSAILCSVLSPIAFFVMENFIKRGAGCFAYLFVIAGFACAFSVRALIKNFELKKFGVSILHLVYPTVCLLFMFLANEEKTNGFMILILSFVISPISDVMAYFTGMAIGGKKLCPKISPKKTWAGAIGGTIGGGLGSMLVYLVFKPRLNFFSPILFFLIVGLIVSVVNIFGDLLESLIKRKAGVKDSGKILPGHGGVLDRIDGTMFAVIAIYIAFLFV